MRLRDKVSAALWLAFFIMLLVIVFFVSVGKNGQADIQLISRQVDQYVYDGEGCLSSQTIETLNRDLKQLEKTTGIQYYVVSTAKYGEHVIEDYCYTIYQDLITSGKPTILLLFSKTQKDMILRSEKIWKEKLNSYFLSHIADNIFDPYLEKNQINEAVLETVEASLLPIAKECNIPIQDIISGEVSQEGYTSFEKSVVVNFMTTGFIFMCFVAVAVAFVSFFVYVYYTVKREKITKIKE